MFHQLSPHVHQFSNKFPQRLQISRLSVRVGSASLSFSFPPQPHALHNHIASHFPHSISLFCPFPSNTGPLSLPIWQRIVRFFDSSQPKYMIFSVWHFPHEHLYIFPWTHYDIYWNNRLELGPDPWNIWTKTKKPNPRYSQNNSKWNDIATTVSIFYPKVLRPSQRSALPRRMTWSTAYERRLWVATRYLLNYHWSACQAWSVHRRHSSVDARALSSKEEMPMRETGRSLYTHLSKSQIRCF